MSHRPSEVILNVSSRAPFFLAIRHGRIALVIDDVQPPWKPRFVEVRGTIQAFSEGGKAINEGFAPEILRLTPTHIVSMGVNDDMVRPGEQKVQYSSRKVQ